MEKQKKISLKQKLISGGSWALVGKGVSVLTGLIINIILARHLEPEDLGSYFLIISITSLATAIGTLGLQQYTVRYIAENFVKENYSEIRTYFFQIFILLFFSSMLLAFIFFSFTSFFPVNNFRTSALTNVNRIVTFLLFFAIFQKIFAEIYRGLKNIKLYVLLSGSSLHPTEGIIPRFFFISGILFLIYVNLNINLKGVLAYLLISIIVAILIAIIYFSKNYRYLVRNSINKKKINLFLKAPTILKSSWPFLINNVMIFVLSQSDILLISSLDSTTGTALYSTTKRLITIWLVPTIIFRTVIGPFIAELYSSGQKEYLEKILRSGITIVGIPTILLLVPLAIWGGDLLGFIYGAFYKQSHILLIIFSFNIIIAIVAGLSEEILYMTGYQKITMNIYLFIGVLILSTGWLGTLHYGNIGMAISFTCCMILKNLLFIYYAKLKTDILPLFTFNFSNIQMHFRALLNKK